MPASPWPMPGVSTMTRSKPAALARGDDVGQRRRQLAAGLARGERAHVDVRAVDGVHADAVAEQRAAGLPPGRIDGDHRDRRIAGVEAEAADQLVGQRRLAGAAGAGDADHRNDAAPVRQRVQLVAAVRRRARRSPAR